MPILGGHAMRKNFILDTNVLLHDPRSIYSFEDNNVIIPIYVIEEIDQFKRDLSELGRNARLVARYLDAFRAEGSLAEGVPLPNGGMLRVSFTNRELPRAMAEKNLTDNRILAVAIDIMEKEPRWSRRGQTVSPPINSFCSRMPPIHPTPRWRGCLPRRENWFP